MCLWKTKTLIITHRDALRTQWINSLYNMSGMSSREVHEITSSEELYDIATGKFDAKYDVYLITHATFRAGMKRIGSMVLAQNITKNLGIGLKIIDEAHLEFRDTILMDCVSMSAEIYISLLQMVDHKRKKTTYSDMCSLMLFIINLQHFLMITFRRSGLTI